MIRTREGLLLERLIHHLKDWAGFDMRHFFCYNGEGPDDSFDCACCITWPDDTLYSQCGCICHVRIEAMAHTSDLRLLFTSLRVQDMLPEFPASWEEQEKLQKKGLNDGRFHYHNVDGRFSNYPRVCCSVCIPCEPDEVPRHPKLLYDTKTGKTLPIPAP